MIGSVGTKLGGRPRPLRKLDPSLVPDPRTQITVLNQVRRQLPRSYVTGTYTVT